MIRGFYTAGSGVVTQEKKLNNIANNLANVSTVGYKSDNLVLGTFGEHLSVRMNAYQNTGYGGTGPAVYMQVVDEKYTDHAQGGFEITSRPLDMAIMGEGYFMVADNNGQEFFTRDGQFSVDGEGYLVLPGFGRVQGEEGDIQLLELDQVMGADTERVINTMKVDVFGTISFLNEEGEYEDIDRIIIAVPEENAVVEKTANSLYSISAYEEATEEDHPDIRQYYLEKSNVNMSNEMSSLIASQRALQSCSQIVKAYDELAERITTQISRV